MQRFDIVINRSKILSAIKGYGIIKSKTTDLTQEQTGRNPDAEYTNSFKRDEITHPKNE